MKEIVFRQSAAGVFEPVRKRRKAKTANQPGAQQIAERRETFWLIVAAVALAMVVAAFNILPTLLLD